MMLRRIVRRTLQLVGAIVLLIVALVVFFDLQRRAREKDDVHASAPMGGRYVLAKDVAVFVQEAGSPSAPTVLLVHGTGTWSEIWRETIDALAPRYHVVAIDLPPFGYSDKPRGAASYSREKQARRIVGVLDAMHIASATLVAHSVGARPAVEAALESPNRIQHLILIDPALGFRDHTNEFEQPQPSRVARGFFACAPLRNAMIATYGTNPVFMRRLFRTFVSNKDAVTDTRLGVILQPMSVARTTDAYGDWLTYLATSHDTSSAADFRNFAHLTMPVDILWGRTDEVTPLWQGEALVKLIPSSRLTVIDGVGHIPYIEDPPRFQVALSQALAR